MKPGSRVRVIADECCDQLGYVTDGRFGPYVWARIDGDLLPRCFGRHELALVDPPPPGIYARIMARLREVRT